MKTITIQNNFNAGVLDPRLKGRVDLPYYGKALQQGTNCLTIPFGGLRRRPGLRYVDTLPRKRVNNTNTATMPEGGTAADISDFSTLTSTVTTGNIGVVNPYIVAHHDYGAAEALVFIDVMGLSLTAGTSTQFVIQHSADNTSWTTLYSIPLVDTTSRNIRVAGVTNRYIRLARVGATDLTTSKVNLAGFWSSTAGAISDVALHEFTYSESRSFLFVLTDYNIAVYENGVLHSNIRSPYPSAAVKAVDSARTDIVTIFVHEDYSPRRLIFDAINNQFVISEVPFVSHPQFDYNDDDSPTPTQAVMTVTFAGFDQGQLYKLQIKGYTTEEIIYTASADGVSAMKRALEALPIIGSGGVSITRALLVYTLTFSDSATENFDNDFTGYSVTGELTDTVTVATTTTGVPRKEDVWSWTRGFPRSVTFHQNRLWFGGTKSKPQSLFGSRVNSYFEFDPKTGLDTDPIFVTLDSKRRNAIQRLASSRTLAIFTTDSEFTVPQGPIKTPEFSVNAETYNGSGDINPVEADGALLFLDKNSGSMREFIFSFGEDAYTSVNRSLISQQLLSNPVDMTAVRPTDTEDATYVVIVNGDGTCAIHSTLRAQEVSNFTPMITNGLFIAAQSVERDAYFAVTRELDAQDENLLEVWDYDCYTDSAVKVTNSPASTAVTGLDHLDGLECRVKADGSVMSNDTPSAGAITLVSAKEEIEVGLNFNCTIQMMPLAPNSAVAHKKKIARQHIMVYESLGLVVDGLVIPMRNFGESGISFGAPTPFTGLLRNIEGQEGWSHTIEPLIEITDPLPFTILFIETEIEVT